ncbi:hypothetical protein A374_12715 [Fictibacillus macauensis ZFHKF-1]|uniref:tRNA(Met) cytidine acetate ligase n=1 Tax=Fictibacillus macauensis ZFHKF-1 TaxID=1196324 RepID=I8UDM4_9BACL|nr:nucleotidyltransferase [Fictibacillus macauensis]EIT84908.1 hypothetical protein A374_12715 [Fictibacillus macauensis ZFHKF-1]
MNTCGIVVEYNPFHNGHYYHLQQSKKQTKSDVMIAVMSGNFLQRGEPAIISKWKRAEMALYSGVDLVVELPYVFAVAPAPIFAKGSISLLAALGANTLCFGSESGSIDLFYHTLEQLNTKGAQYDQFLQTFLKQGQSFPKAASNAAQALHIKNGVDLTLPNNILGMEYVKAIQKDHPLIQAQTILRKGASYHETNLEADPIASATAIRTTIAKEGALTDRVLATMPPSSAAVLQQEWEKNHIMTWDALYPALRYKLLSTDESAIAALYEVEEGLEHRLKKAALQCDTFTDFMTHIKTKRYTWTRLQRMCLHILHNLAREQAKQWMVNGPAYVRILGMSSKGQEHLRRIKKAIPLPLVTTVSKCDHEMLAFEQQTAAVYHNANDPNHASELIKAEYSTPPLQREKA